MITALLFMILFLVLLCVLVPVMGAWAVLAIVYAGVLLWMLSVTEGNTVVALLSATAVVFIWIFGGRWWNKRRSPKQNRN